MRLVKVIVLLSVAACVSLSARQLFQKRSSDNFIEPSGSRELHLQVEVVSSIPREQSGLYDLGSVVLLDNGLAWAVGYDGKHLKRIYQSTNNGKTWGHVSVPGDEFTLKAISFSDSANGWAVGGKGLIIRTTDSGKSWKLLKSPTSMDLNAVHFAGSSVGYMAGTEKFGDKFSGEVSGNFEMFCTNNGGETWRACFNENTPSNVFQITSTSEFVAFAVIDGNRLLRTDDQGRSWRVIQLPVGFVSSIAFAPGRIGWLVGSGGAFLRSNDDGVTWKLLPSLPNEFGNRDWNAVAFNEKGCGIAVGEKGTLALTTDSGKTWELQNLQISEHLRSVQLRDSWAIILGAQNAYTLRLE